MYAPDHSLGGKKSLHRKGHPNMRADPGLRELSLKLGSDAHLLAFRSYDAPISLACSKSSFARPYIWRLMSFRRVIWPSV